MMHKQALQDLFKYVNSNRKHLLLAFVALLFVFLFFSQIKSILIVASLAILGAFGQLYKRIARIPSAVEFVTFGTVVVAVAYGPVAGALFALAVSFAAEIISGGIDAFVLVYWPVRILSGIFAATMPFGSIISTGIATTLFINLLAQPVYILSSDSEMKVKGIVYLVSNIAFNILLFRFLGEAVLGFAA